MRRTATRGRMSGVRRGHSGQHEILRTVRGENGLRLLESRRRALRIVGTCARRSEGVMRTVRRAGVYIARNESRLAGSTPDGARNHEVNVAAKKSRAGEAVRSAPGHAKSPDSRRARATAKTDGKRERSRATGISAASRPKSRARAQSAEEISDLDIEAIGALERFAQYARVALTSLRGGNRVLYVAHLRRVRSSYECIYGHPVALMTIVREAKTLVDAATLHHSRGGAVDLEGVPVWVTQKSFERLLASLVVGRGRGRSAKGSVVAGVVRLVHARCPHAGAKRLRAEHLTAT
jgi:hypothetical protein